MSDWLQRHRGTVVGAWMLLSVFAVGTLSVRAYTEPARLRTAVETNTAGIRDLLAEQEKEIRADCPFKRQVALLPGLSQRRTAAVVALADSARDAYIRKGCEAAGFGTVPPRFKANA